MCLHQGIHPQSTPRAPAPTRDARLSRHSPQGLVNGWGGNPFMNLVTHGTVCKQLLTTPLLFLSHGDTHFWCAVTLVCACVDLLGVDWGSGILLCVTCSPCVSRDERSSTRHHRVWCDLRGTAHSIQGSKWITQAASMFPEMAIRVHCCLISAHCTSQRIWTLNFPLQRLCCFGSATRMRGRQL